MTGEFARRHDFHCGWERDPGQFASGRARQRRLLVDRPAVRGVAVSGHRVVAPLAMRVCWSGMALED